MYKEDIIGYITIEFISFADGKKTLFWAIDLKRGLTDTQSHFQFVRSIQKLGSFGTISSQNANDSNHQDISEILLNKNKQIAMFSIPSMISPKIAYLKMKEMVNMFRNEHLIYDIDRKTGIVFSISDIIQAGIIGIFGISESERSNLQLLEESISTFLTLLPDGNGSSNSDLKYDDVPISEIVTSIKAFIKQKMKIINE